MIRRIVNIVLWMAGRRSRYRIGGRSMLPALCEGDIVFVDRKIVAGDIFVGDIVLARHPYKTDLAIVKRIGGVTAEGLYYLVGDNAAESSDSGSFGAIPLSSIEGKVACVIPVNP